jgi:hypothetical protein
MLLQLGQCSSLPRLKLKVSFTCSYLKVHGMADYQQLAAEVSAAVQERFASLPKNGKPQAHEHTVLAGTTWLVMCIR